MIKIAITGGICTGKSTICGYLEKKGYEVFYSDQIAIKLAENDNVLKSKILESFGPLSYSGNTYDRKYVAAIVFSDKQRLNEINEMFAPFLRREFNNFAGGKTVVFYESALVFEHNIQDNFDEVWCAYADIKTVKERLRARNNFSNEEIDNRLKSQMDNATKATLSNIVIDTTLPDLEKRLDEIIKDLWKDIQ